LFAYGPADATASENPIISSHLKPDWFYLSRPAYPCCHGKEAIKWVVIFAVQLAKLTDDGRSTTLGNSTSFALFDSLFNALLLAAKLYMTGFCGKSPRFGSGRPAFIDA